MKIIPLHGYVLVQEAKNIVENSSLNKSGIILPEGVDEDEMNNQGKIIKLPKESGAYFKEGDYVIFNRHMFNEVKLDKKVYLLGKIEDVIGIIEV